MFDFQHFATNAAAGKKIEVENETFHYLLESYHLFKIQEYYANFKRQFF